MQNNCITIYVLPMNHLSQKLLAYKNKLHPTLGIDAKFMQTNSCENIDNIKCIGSKYMDIK